MAEINLMEKYPRSKRNVDGRGIEKTDKDIALAKKFGKEFFDGDRSHGYGGFNYDPRFWTGVVSDMKDFYHLDSTSKVLDIGCAKGFMIYDFITAIPGIDIRGIDISEYSVEHAKNEVKQLVSVGDARNLTAYNDNEFDLVISINTLHNLKLDDCKKSIKEVQRIGKHSFIVNDAWNTTEEEKRMKMWNLTAETYMHVEDWKKLFNEIGYEGDYHWFIP